MAIPEKKDFTIRTYCNGCKEEVLCHLHKSTTYPGKRLVIWQLECGAGHRITRKYRTK